MLRGHGDDHLAAVRALPVDSLVGRRGVGKRQHGLHHGPNAPCIHQVRDLDQLIAIRLDDEERAFQPLVAGCGNAGRDGDQTPSRIEQCPGTFRRVATYRVKHHVDSLGVVLKPRGTVIDDLVSAELPHEVNVRRRRSSHHMRATESRQLHGEHAYAARTAMNQNALARLQVGVVEQPLLRGQRPDGNRSRLNMGQAARFGRDVGRLSQAILGQGSVRVPIVQTVDGLPHFHAVHALAYRRDDA